MAPRLRWEGRQAVSAAPEALSIWMDGWQGPRGLGGPYLLMSWKQLQQVLSLPELQVSLLKQGIMVGGPMGL